MRVVASHVRRWPYVPRPVLSLVHVYRLYGRSGDVCSRGGEDVVRAPCFYESLGCIRCMRNSIGTVVTLPLFFARSPHPRWARYGGPSRVVVPSGNNMSYMFFVWSNGLIGDNPSSTVPLHLFVVHYRCCGRVHHICFAGGAMGCT